MVENGKRTTMPKLRFPEFRTRLGWKSIRLGDVSTPVTERVGERKLTPVSISAGVGFVPQAEKFGRDISGNQYSLYTLVRDGDFVYNKGNSLRFPQGCVYQLRGWGEVAAPNVFISFRLKQGFVAEYFQYCFEKNIHGVQLKQHITSGARSNGLLNVSKDQFYGVGIPMPLPDEQQKIADCLSSLDELIAAQVRNVEALKSYKLSLVQRLFPRAGETQPRLRFPEFQNSGEWMREELSRCLEKVIDYRGKAPPKSNSGVPLITARNVRFGWLDMTSDEYIGEGEYTKWMSKGIPQDGDILFTTEAPLGNVALFPSTGRFALGQRLLTLRPRSEKCLSAFLFQSLLGPSMQKEIDFHSTGTTAKGIKSTVFVKISFCYPGVDEQRRIADYLTSLDNIIAGETNKLAALNTHKKGLMQQLFPSQEET